MTWVDVIRTTLGLVALGVIFYAWVLEPCRIAVNHVTLEIPDLPPVLEGFSICQLSDLHIAGWGRVERALKRLLSQVQADICAITGDIVAKADATPTLKQLFEGFRPKFGIFGVPGNGEYDPWMPEMDILARDLETAGVRMLVNKSTTFHIGNSKMTLIGVDDPFTGKADLNAVGKEKEENEVRILLAHSPDIVESLSGHGIDVVLAGHTHGGQILLPFIGALWIHCRIRLPKPAGYFTQAMVAQMAGDPADVR